MTPIRPASLALILALPSILVRTSHLAHSASVAVHVGVDDFSGSKSAVTMMGSAAAAPHCGGYVGSATRALSSGSGYQASAFVNDVLRPLMSPSSSGRRSSPPYASRQRLDKGEGWSIFGTATGVRPRRTSRGRIYASGGGGGGRGITPPPDNSPQEYMNGIFAVYKPKGFTSAHVVQKIKNTLSKGLRNELYPREDEAGRDLPMAGEGASEEGAERKKQEQQLPPRRKGPKIKVGHGGTLDPMATGVLVIGVGRGCRDLTGYLSGSKAYRAEALLGWETNTQDAEGEATMRGDWEHVTNEAVESLLGQFTGSIMQTPPMFSAIRKDGKRMYELARRGETVEREAREVVVHGLRLVDPPLPLPNLGLEVESGGGFYVRTMIEDLCRAVGTRGHMIALERTRQGPFTLEHTLPIESWTYDGLRQHLEKSNKRKDEAAAEYAAESPPVALSDRPSEPTVESVWSEVLCSSLPSSQKVTRN